MRRAPCRGLHGLLATTSHPRSPRATARMELSRLPGLTERSGARTHERRVPFGSRSRYGSAAPVGLIELPILAGHSACLDADTRVLREDSHALHAAPHAASFMTPASMAYAVTHAERTSAVYSSCKISASVHSNACWTES